MSPGKIKLVINGGATVHSVLKYPNLKSKTRNSSFSPLHSHHPHNVELMEKHSTARTCRRYEFSEAELLIKDEPVNVQIIGNHN